MTPLRPFVLLCAAALIVLLGVPLRAGEARPKKGHLDLVVDRTEHDFGVVPQDTVRTATFTYTNKSDAAVDGIRTRGECGCNAVSVDRTSLPPGESGTLTVEFNTLMLGGHLTKRVHVVSKDYRRGEIVIPLKIAIVQGMIVRPAGVTYGDVLLGTKPTRDVHLKWYEGHGKPFEITSVEVPGFEFDSTVLPYKDAQDGKWGGWTVRLGFKQPPPLGPFSAEVLVRTTDEVRPRLTLPLYANVCGKVWMQSRTLSFGAFDQGTQRQASLKFRPFDESVTFGEVRAHARLGRIDVEVKPDPRHGDKGVWRLYGRVPLETPVGTLDDEVIELHTGAPGEEITLVKVKGTIRTPR